MKWVGVKLAKLEYTKTILKEKDTRMKGEGKTALPILKKSEKKIKKIQRKKLGEDKASRKEYNKIEIDCEFCECKVKKCRWKAHTETQKHKNNEMIKRKEEEKLNKMTEEEKDECDKIKKLKKIWKKVRL